MRDGLFVPLSIKKTMTTTLAALWKAIRSIAPPAPTIGTTGCGFLILDARRRRSIKQIREAVIMCAATRHSVGALTCEIYATRPS
jgi:hypothetical protein